MKKFSAFLFLILISACSHNSGVKDVSVEYPQWREAGTSAKMEVEKDWWKNFEDEKLSQIIEISRQNSQDIQIALSRIEQSRANEAAVLGQNLPVVNADVSLDKRRNSQNLNSNISNRRYTNSIFAGFDASWEVDIFGIEPAMRAAGELTEKYQADYNSALVSLFGEVAASYFDVRRSQMELSQHSQKVQLLEEKLELQKSLLVAGRIDGVQYAATQSEISAARSQMELLSNQFKAQKYALELLTGSKPGALDDIINGSFSYTVPPKELVAGAPAEVLAHRPDVISAEKNLRYSGAVKDVAVTNLLPKISLAGLLGYESGNGSNLFRSNSLTWEASAAALMPLLDYKKLHADIESANAQEAEAVATYNKAMLTALSDVETSFSAYSSSSNNLDVIKEKSTSNARQEKYMNERYEKGFSSYVEFIDSRILNINSEIELEDAKFENLIQLVRVYKSLGGGW